MTTPESHLKLKLLGYSSDWIAAGILTESEFASQLQEFPSGEDTNKEHYRFRTLANYLRNNETLSDNQVKHIIRLLRKDVDKSMAGSALLKLLSMPALTDKQFALISSVLTSFGSWTEKQIEKQHAIRAKKNASD
jgi:hypothetical protein